MLRITGSKCRTRQNVQAKDQIANTELQASIISGPHKGRKKATSVVSTNITQSPQLSPRCPTKKTGTAIYLPLHTLLSVFLTSAYFLPPYLQAQEHNQARPS